MTVTERSAELERTWFPALCIRLRLLWLRLKAALGRQIERLKSAPVTFGYATLLTVTGIGGWILRSISVRVPVTLGSVATSPSSLLTRPWSILTSAIWLPGPVYYLAAICVFLLCGSILERRLGSGRFAIAAVASQILGITMAAGLVWAMRPAMGAWATVLSANWYLGPTAPLCGVAMAATAAMPGLWRRRLRTIVPTILLLLALYEGSFADLVRLSAAAVGMLSGPYLLGRRPAFRWPAVSRREARVLVALGIAACAIGPVIAGLSRHAPGPLSVLRYLFTDIQPVDPQALTNACASPLVSPACQMMLFQLRAGAGGIFMAILPCFLLLLCAEGLRRGRRFAWRSTLVVLGSMAALAVTHIAGVLWPRALGTVQNENMAFQNLSHLHYALGLVVPLLLPVVLFLLVAGFRNLFTLGGPLGASSRLGRRVAAVGGGLAAVYFVGGLLISQGFTPVPSPAELLADVPDRFLPLGYTLDIAPAFFPESTPAVVIYEGTGIIFWAVTGALVLHSFLQSERGEDGTEDLKVRDILRSGAGGALSWMTTWPGNRYWFAEDCSGYIAYRVHSGVALALGGPVGQTATYGTSVEGFVRFCGDNGWTPCFYSADQDFRDAMGWTGWSSVEVGQQTVIPLPAFTFAGRRFQHIRTKVNRAQKEGVIAEWASYSKAPPEIRQQIDELSEEWVAGKKLPELGFTLGGIAQLQDPEVRCLIALDSNLTVHGVTSWLPVYHNGRIIGWTLDMMRRRRGGFPNSIEILIATAAQRLKDEGYEYVSLSGAPLARSPQEADDGNEQTSLNRVLDWVGNRLEPVYGFRSLLAFKSKFAPRYEPLYLVYNDAAALPSIANAIATAYLGEISILQRLALARQVLFPQA